MTKERVNYLIVGTFFIWHIYTSTAQSLVLDWIAAIIAIALITGAVTTVFFVTRTRESYPSAVRARIKR
jgi:hypothetical protein